MLIKEEPPATGRKSATDWPSVIAELKKSPGEWFMVAEDVATSTGTYLRQRYGVDTRLHSVAPDGLRTEKLYARWPEHKAQEQEQEQEQGDTQEQDA